MKGMCNKTKRCSVSRDTGLSVAFTIAHEMGHKSVTHAVAIFYLCLSLCVVLVWECSMMEKEAICADQGRAWLSLWLPLSLRDQYHLSGRDAVEIT